MALSAINAGTSDQTQGTIENKNENIHTDTISPTNPNKYASPGTPGNFCNCIEFEYYPDTSPTVENDPINLEYLNFWSGQGQTVSFWMSVTSPDPVGGRQPAIVKTGSPAVGFEGVFETNVTCGVFTQTMDDMVLPDYQKFTGCSYLTDDDPSLYNPDNIMIEILPPVTEFYGEIIDVDGLETATITAYKFDTNLGQYVVTGNPVSYNMISGNGRPAPWLIATKDPFERLVISNGQPIGFGGDFAIDNLCLSAPSSVRIEAPFNCMLNSTQKVNLVVDENCLSLGKFDFTVTYDPSAMTLVKVDPGSIFSDYGWESFAYAIVQVGDPMCDMMGAVMVGGTADLPAPPQPTQYVLQPGDTYAQLTFQITSDYNFECMFIPISFCWQGCSDNSLYSTDGSDEYISLAVYDAETTDFNGPYNERMDITDPTAVLDSRGGAPNSCIPNQWPTPIRQRYIVLKNGGVHILCSDAICGDPTDDGSVNILDVVFLINYKYKDGPAPDPLSMGEIDGVENINILDIVYLINYLYKEGPGPVC